MNDPKLVSAKEIAARYSVTPKIVRKWARCGILPVVRFTCRCVRFDVEKCDLAVERRTKLGNVRIGSLVLRTAILLPLLLAQMATNWQPNPHQRGHTAFVNRWSGVRAAQPAPCFLALKKLVATILSPFGRRRSLAVEVAW